MLCRLYSRNPVHSSTVYCTSTPQARSAAAARPHRKPEPPKPVDVSECLALAARRPGRSLHRLRSRLVSLGLSRSRYSLSIYLLSLPLPLRVCERAQHFKLSKRFSLKLVHLHSHGTGTGGATGPTAATRDRKGDMATHLHLPSPPSFTQINQQYAYACV